MTGPSWLAVGFAGLMLLIAASCVTRLAVWWLRGRGTELDADGLHILMGMAMAGMLEPRLSPLPDTVWRAVFLAGAGWFGWQAVGARIRRKPSQSRCAHPVPHAVECAAMLYMLLPAKPAARGPAMAMPGMNGPAAVDNPALALVLALFMVGYILWTTDQLAVLSRVRAAGTGHGEPYAASAACTSGPAGLASRRALAPRFAACYKIAMSIAMGYMLVMMV